MCIFKAFDNDEMVKFRNQVCAKICRIKVKKFLGGAMPPCGSNAHLDSTTCGTPLRISPTLFNASILSIQTPYPTIYREASVSRKASAAPHYGTLQVFDSKLDM